LDVTPGPRGRQEAGGGDVADVAGVDPGQRQVDGPRHAKHPLLQHARVHEQVGEEHPAAQMQHRRTGRIQGDLGRGEPVDLARSRTPFGPDAALEHGPPDPVLLDGPRGDRAHGGMRRDRIFGIRRRRHPEQRVSPLGGGEHGIEIALVGLCAVDERTRLGVQSGRVAQQERGSHAGLEQEPDDARADASGRG
jgi:hypothetical protein